MRSWLRRRANKEIDDRLTIRLDRITRGQQETKRTIDHLSASMQISVFNFLTLLAFEFPFDADRLEAGRSE